MLKKWKQLLGLFLVMSLVLSAMPQHAEAHLYKNKYTHEQVANFIIKTGLKYKGAPYKFGASMKSAPYYFDCSSFTKYVFGKAGIYLPRTAQAQSKYGIRVPVSKIQRGDLLFFRVPGRGVSIGHVAIYLGDGKMLHTYGAGGVKVSKINSYWKSKFVKAKRMY